MLAVVYDGKPEMEIREIDIKPVGADEVLIKIDTATICGTDLHILDGKFEVKPPVALGHEFSGYVEKIGEEVTNCKVGDLVSVEPHIYCGLCKYCRIGRPNLCVARKAWGINMNGGFGQYVVARHDTVYQVPEAVSAEKAALAETIGCCLNGINQVNIRIGDTVVIQGGGAAGVIMTQLAKQRGAAKIIVSEPSLERREFILKRGADIAVNPLEDSLVDIVKKETNNLGADVVIDAAGRKETAQLSMELVCKGARILFFGVVSPGQYISVEPNYMFEKELTIMGSIRNPFTHHQVLEILPKLDLEGVVSHRFPLKDFEKAFEMARKGQGFKIGISPNE
ncbi:zinc-dependent alcohol dehydrogenase family protein [Petroclostridium sp. X23]|uniref:zinc-dependent alcohol dehydrogenase family protein n=1 Tax=Petroclostridium sp. X23 TaxID=3045146 RepID=UPI0024AD9E21|nr:zinc-dependent alcohol dehydrogenase family protein [Petroclostridium sp. X23]WHH60899.1 zinc-dependent alcohol dehydrogenase family protein [Petroclostridium sp. X23]